MGVLVSLGDSNNIYLSFKQVELLTIFTCIPFIFYLLKPLLFGFDGYSYLSLICNGSEMPAFTLPLASILFQLLPCNILAIKLVLLCLALLFVYFTALLGSVFDKENGWKAGLWIWFSPILFFEFAKFENEAFAYPIILAALWIFFSEKNLKGFISGFGLLTAVTFLLWGGAIVPFLAICVSYLPLLLFSIPALFFLWKKISANLFSFKGHIAENAPIIAYKYWFILLLGITGLPKQLILTTLALLAAGFIQVKFAILAIPFLVIGMNNLIKEFKLEKLAYTIIIILVFVYGFAMLQQPPTPTQIQAIKYTITQSPDKNISNDWSYGWLVKYLGGTTDSFCYYKKQQDFTGWSVSTQDLNCTMIKNFGDAKVFYC